MNPIVLESEVMVPEGVALTVLEGVEVSFSGNGRLHVEGSLRIRGASGQEVHFNRLGEETANAEIVVQGSSAILSASHCHFDGSNIEARDGAVCDLSDCRFESVDRPLLAIKTRINVQDCEFVGMAQEGIALDSLFTPDSLRVTLPPRMVAGKTMTFRAEVLDKNGNLYWWMWDGIGTVSAFRHNTNVPVPLSESEFRVINGIGSLTTSLNDPGLVDFRISIDGLSATRTVDVLDPNGQTLELTGMTPAQHLEWGPDDGIIHLTGQTVIPATGNLVVRAGALVMLDFEAELEVFGTIRVEGTAEAPVYFFAANPPFSWAQIRHRNSTQEMVYDYAIFTGGGVGPKETGEEHTFDGPILRFRPFEIGGGKGARISHCVFADNEGKGIFAHSGERFVITDCLITRCEFGAEIHGDTVLVEDSYFLDINTGKVDQDALYLWRSMGEHRVRRSIIAYTGDDGIDTWESDVEVSDCLIYGANDKNISLFRNDADITNCLFFGAQYGVQPRERPNGLARMEQCTFADHSTAGVRIINASTHINRSILWGNTQSLASFPEPAPVGVEHSILNLPEIPIEGEGNRFVDPHFRNPAKKDYRLSPHSPGIQTGLQGGNLGWLGFPRPDSLPAVGPSVIRGCQFKGGEDVGVLLRHGTDCLIEDCRFENLARSAVKAEGKNWLEVRSTLIVDCDEGIVLRNEGIGILDHLTMVDCATAAVRIEESDVHIESSIFWNCGMGIVMEGGSETPVSFSNIGPGLGAVFPGTRNLNTDPLFVDPEAGDYRLQPQSPCIRAGEGRTDMGAFQASGSEPRSVWFVR